MAHLGIGAEQFGIDAANFGIGLDTGNIGSVMAMAMVTDAVNAQQDAAAQQAVEPESQLDIVQEREITESSARCTKPAKATVTKRKYTKRAK